LKTAKATVIHLPIDLKAFVLTHQNISPFKMQYSILLTTALFTTRVLSKATPVLSSFWIGQISGEQECGVGGAGGTSQDCNEGGTWATSDLSNFCSHIGIGSVYPAANGPRTNWCNITVGPSQRRYWRHRQNVRPEWRLQRRLRRHLRDSL
jgi:hypothetical protein